MQVHHNERKKDYADGTKEVSKVTRITAVNMQDGGKAFEKVLQHFKM